MQTQDKQKHDYGRFDFMGKAPVFGGLSGLLFVLAIIVIAIKGFNYGIDFSGGVSVELHFPQTLPMAELRKIVEKQDFKKFEISDFGNNQDFTVRFESKVGKNDEETNQLQNAAVKQLTDSLNQDLANNKVEIRQVESVGPQVGSELKRNGILAAFYALLLILIYIGVRFDFRYAVAAVLCLFHDTIVTLGLFSLINYEINVQIVAAILTLIGFSLNDTIINFDRIRENSVIWKGRPLKWIMNRSINEMLTRTILTSTATLACAFCLYFIAGGVLRDIGLTFIIGILLGTYSSIYVASPLVEIVDKIKNMKAAR